MSIAVHPPPRLRIVRRGIGLSISFGLAACGVVALSSSAAADGSATDEETVVDEDFSSGEVPGDWTVNGGDWSVREGQLIGVGGSGRDRITFGDTPENFRFEADVTFEQVVEPTRWINFIFDFDTDADAGSAVGLRSATTASNGVELCAQHAPGDYTCDTTSAPFDMGAGTQHHVVVEVNGPGGTVSIDGVQVASSDTAWSRDFAGALGFIVNGSTVAFDNVVVTDLGDVPAPLGTVTGLRATPVADSVTAVWNAPSSFGADAAGEPATLGHYEVAIAPSGTGVDGLDWHSTEATTFDWVGLEPGDYTMWVRVVNSLGETSEIAATGARVSEVTESGIPLEVSGGAWPAGHVQSIAVDREGGYIYYSFTSMLVKSDLSGRIIGTVGNFGSGAMGDGHFGDLAFNPADGMVYGSLEFDPIYYAAIFDVDRITEMDMSGQGTGIIKTVALDEIAQDYLTDLDGDGVVGPDDAASNDHRFGTAGFDGVAFGPKFGESDGENYLTVAYGIYARPDRDDNDHQVLLQYDVSDWDQYAQVFDESNLHTEGPAEPDSKLFIRTGNSQWGVQNLTYDAHLERWFMSTYGATKAPAFPDYNLFAFEADTQPEWGEIVGTGERGWLMDLADGGLTHEATGIRGWQQNATTGFESLGNGLFFIGTSWESGDLEGATLNLFHWTGDTPAPFAEVTAADLAVLPGFTSQAPGEAEVGVGSSHTFTAAGTPSPTFAVTSGALPEGLSLDARTGALSGTPTAAGSFSFEVTARNQVIADATQQVDLSVGGGAVDETAPTVTVKDHGTETVGGRVRGVYKMVSFKLFDESTIDKVVLNGTDKDLTDNEWSDLNVVEPGTFGAVRGRNTLEVHDAVGNVTTVEFVLV